MRKNIFEKLIGLGVAVLILALGSTTCAAASDPLPSWNKSPAKKAIVSFVSDVSNQNSPDFLPPSRRIAVFDNDGTLWAEQPLYFQLIFAMDRVRALAPEHPEWKEKQPFKAVLENDKKALAEGGMHAVMELVMASHSGMTTDEFAQIVKEWIATARHPTTGKLYTEMVYQPMLELLAYMQAHQFKTFIVSGGGIEFLRVWAEDVYRIPPDQVLGSSVKTKFELRDGVPVLVRLPELGFLDDKAGKVVGMNLHIGSRPVAAFGNSDGDFEMLQWVSAGPGRTLGVYIHHTDEKREWAYDRKSHIGALDRGLDQAGRYGWHLVDMKKDWARVYKSETR